MTSALPNYTPLVVAIIPVMMIPVPLPVMVVMMMPVIVCMGGHSPDRAQRTADDREGDHHFS